MRVPLSWSFLLFPFPPFWEEERRIENRCESSPRGSSVFPILSRSALSLRSPGNGEKTEDVRAPKAEGLLEEGGLPGAGELGDAQCPLEIRRLGHSDGSLLRGASPQQ